jgi:hypothetical protein
MERGTSPVCHQKRREELKSIIKEKLRKYSNREPDCCRIMRRLQEWMMNSVHLNGTKSKSEILTQEERGNSISR